MRTENLRIVLLTACAVLFGLAGCDENSPCDLAEPEAGDLVCVSDTSCKILSQAGGQAQCPDGYIGQQTCPDRIGGDSHVSTCETPDGNEYF